MNNILANFNELQLDVPRFLNLLFITGTVLFALLAVAVKLAGNDD